MQRLQVYVLLQKGAGGVGVVRNPLHLQGYPQETWLLSPPLPSNKAYSLLEIWQKRLQGLWKPIWRNYIRWNPQYKQISASAKSNGEDEEVWQALLQLVQGRLVTEKHLFSALRQQGFWPADVSRVLDLGVIKGALSQVPGIKENPWGRQVCARCNSEDVMEAPCTNCGLEDCTLCRQCANMGAIRGCSTLISAKVPPLRPKTVPSHPTYDLTPVQKTAAAELVQFWESPEKQALLWAATGAGKTEVTFPLIRRALQEGQRVLFAIPRAEIVREMGERLQKAFPHTAVAIHYGGQPAFATGDLVIATTHQVLRFFRRFGLIILDEVDAFPYQGSEMLRFGMQRALAPAGKLVEMTATPHSLRQQRIITIPVRFHGYPLPEPQIEVVKLPRWQELARQKEVPPWVEALAGHPWLLFAPTIAACTAVYDYLRTQTAQKIGVCHSKEPQRFHEIRRFREGRLDVLVTTSILERGVNFSGVGALVLYADHPLFSSSALIQMAGRVGRAAQSPTGPVLFIGAKATPAMRRAVRLIRRLNEEAATKGLLNDATLS